MNNMYFIILSILIILYIVYSVRKGHLSIKTSFVWILASIVMLLLSIFPYSIDFVAHFLGIEYPPTLLLTLCIIVLLILNFNISNKMAKLQEKVIDLAQEVSVLKENKNGKNK